MNMAAILNVYKRKQAKDKLILMRIQLDSFTQLQPILIGQFLIACNCLTAGGKITRHFHRPGSRLHMSGHAGGSWI